jgi:hypothetical protein
LDGDCTVLVCMSEHSKTKRQLYTSAGSGGRTGVWAYYNGRHWQGAKTNLKHNLEESTANHSDVLSVDAMA